MPWNCLWGYEPAAPACRVSGPLHLILQKEGVGQAHTFRSKSFRKPRPCHWCHQPVHNQGSCCRVCKYVCHTTCESKKRANENKIWLTIMSACIISVILATLCRFKARQSKRRVQ